MEIDVPRRIDQVQFVDLVAAQSSRMATARALMVMPRSLEIHIVQELFAQLAARNGTGLLDQPIGQRALAMVDVSDDAEISDVLTINSQNKLP